MLPANKKRLVIPPKDGWLPWRYYIVDVAFSSGNPIHRTLFYSGAISDGKPCGYNHFINHDNSKRDSEYYEAFYLKALYILPDLDQINPIYHMTMNYKVS